MATIGGARDRWTLINSKLLIIVYSSACNFLFLSGRRLRWLWTPDFKCTQSQRFRDNFGKCGPIFTCDGVGHRALLLWQRVTSKVIARIISQETSGALGQQSVQGGTSKPAISPKRGNTRPMLLLTTNRKLHTRFRLIPKSTILHDTKRPFRSPPHC